MSGLLVFWLNSGSLFGCLFKHLQTKCKLDSEFDSLLSQQDLDHAKASIRVTWGKYNIHLHASFKYHHCLAKHLFYFQKLYIIYIEAFHLSCPNKLAKLTQRKSCHTTIIFKDPHHKMSIKSSVHLFIVFLITFFCTGHVFVGSHAPPVSEAAQPAFKDLAAGPFGIHWWVGTHRWSRLGLNCHVLVVRSRQSHRNPRCFELLLSVKTNGLWMQCEFWFLDSWTVEIDFSFSLWYCRNTVVNPSCINAPRDWKGTWYLTSKNQTIPPISPCLRSPIHHIITIYK